MLESEFYKKIAKLLYSRIFLLRKHIYRIVNIRRVKTILDAGSGYGYITRELCLRTNAKVYGLEKDKNKISDALPLPPNGEYILGNMERAPFNNETFDFILFHFSLMWMKANHALSEAYRILRKNGWIAIIEPDYGGRVEYPETGAKEKIILALKESGADPFIGRKLYHLSIKNGFVPVEYAVLSWHYDKEIRKIESMDEINTYHVTPPEIAYLPIFWLVARKPISK